jgi:hypothetical protein
MVEVPEDDDISWNTGFGACHSVSGDKPELDLVEKLRDCVEEVTGFRERGVQKRKIGFY